jgi:hypothetical protein
MKKKIMAVFICVLVIILASPVLVSAKQADASKGLRGSIGQAGKSNNAFVELWEKGNFDLPVEEGGWAIDTEGAWGKLKYGLTGSSFNFHFNGHGLEPGLSYSLVYYPDPWPGTGLIVFGTAIANEDGNILIKGSAEIDALPAEGDANEGAKIWLVLSTDVGEGQMADWTPAEYLFEYDLVTFNTANPEAVTSESTEGNSGNPNKPAKPEKAEKSNNGKGNNK